LFCAVFRRRDKAFPSCRWQRKITRGEAAKIENPLWEQVILSSNLSAPTIQIQPDTELLTPSKKFGGVAFVGGAFC